MMAIIKGTRWAFIVIEVEIDQRSNGVRRSQVGTPGGTKLRTLRERAGRTQLWVELEAELGTGYLQRIESGRVAQPVRATLERILTALDTGYSERREVLECFGYTVVTMVPTEAEMAWACTICHRELHEVPFPAYVLDCRYHLIAWNGYVPFLFGVSPSDSTLGGLAHQSLLEAWFDDHSPLAALINEPDSFFPALIRALYYEIQLFHMEPWCEAVLDRLQRLPRFRHYWSVVAREPTLASAARALIPIRIARPDAPDLAFRLSSEHFIRDARFRLVYYFPADPATMHQCSTWSTQTHATA